MNLDAANRFRCSPRQRLVITFSGGLLLFLANNRALMGDHRPGLFSNAVLALLVVVSVYLTATDSAEWWRLLTRTS